MKQLNFAPLTFGSTRFTFQVLASQSAALAAPGFPLQSGLELREVLLTQRASKMLLTWELRKEEITVMTMCVIQAIKLCHLDLGDREAALRQLKTNNFLNKP